jgi:hypothetical protein
MLGADLEDRLLISHGMCSTCQAAARARSTHVPTLVVPAEYADLVPSLERLLQETGIPVVLERRVAQRRQGDNGTPGDDRRRGPDRRCHPPAHLH